MLCVKKIYNNDLLQLALVLSLLRLDFSLYLYQDPYLNTPIRNFTSTISQNLPESYQNDYVNPKNLDNILLNYERQLFEDLNSLGRYNGAWNSRNIPQNYNISAYLLNVERGGNHVQETVPESENSTHPDSGIENVSEDETHTTPNITQEDYLLDDCSSSSVDSADFLHTSNNPLLNDVPKDFQSTTSKTQESLIKTETEDNEDNDLLSPFGEIFDDDLQLFSTLSVSKTEYVDPKLEEEVPENIFSDIFDNDIDEGAVGPIIGELTQEDMDLIEVLWKQDVDLGFSLETVSTETVKTDPNDLASDLKALKFSSNSKDGLAMSPTCSHYTAGSEDYEEKLKAIEALNDGSLKTENSGDESDIEDPWAGLQYTIDTETGEYVLKSGIGTALPSGHCDNSLPLPLEDLDTLPLSLPDLLFEENLPISDFDEEESPKVLYDSDIRDEASPLLNVFGSSDSNSVASTSAQPDPGTDEEDILTMIQTAQFHSPHPHAFQNHMNPYGRMNEQRWQDVAGLLGDTHHGGSVVPHGASGISHHPSGSHHAAAFSAHHAVAALHNLGHGHHPHMSAYGPSAHNVTLGPTGATMQDPTTHHHHHHGIPPAPFSNITGTNLGTAVATSINLTNTAEAIDAGASASYKMENATNPSHDIMYFPNTSSEISNATDGFLSSILNDEDLQLMDMAMGDGMYPMRMLDGNQTALGATSGLMSSRMDIAAAAASERMDASSDSAVSSMGSERVASLSDNEWGDATSDSGHTAADHYILDYASKYRPYDYSYTNRGPQTPNNLLGTSDTRRLSSSSSVAQKKHHMFGKRFFQDQHLQSPPSNMKYDYNLTSTTPIDIRNGQSIGSDSARAKVTDTKFPCAMDHPGHLHSGRSTLDHIHHNHTYNLPPESTGTMQRPVFRDKIKNEDEPHLTRDEKRARALNVPLSVDDIINLPMDEFNERLSKFDLSEPQLSLIRDIRRRGKNKVAAQNCRKRKLDQILSLADEVKDMRDRKNRLLAEREFMVSERQRVKEKFTQLYRHVLRNLRDPDGNPYSPSLYSLQQSADGTVIIVPKSNITDPKDKKPPQ
ncbi:segmentation protein cap'n'collar isoform X2 [Chrysoperla carnea]|uniref:segmentation protein cap'n'collar isoform X2 n=1 Tax=Chrysoperla carnea TaxID=189513 RepID=UPI001D091775|nr:segmentation protein cap'n'collar isoform X2 [Chrysoperla carnea]